MTPTERQWPEPEPPENRGAPSQVPDLDIDWQFGEALVGGRRAVWKQHRITGVVEWKDMPVAEPHTPELTPRQAFLGVERGKVTA